MHSCTARRGKLVMYGINFLDSVSERNYVLLMTTTSKENTEILGGQEASNDANNILSHGVRKPTAVR